MTNDDLLGAKPAPDIAEQQRPVSDDDTQDDPTDAPPEADVADVAEQRQSVPIQPDGEPRR